MAPVQATDSDFDAFFREEKRWAAVCVSLPVSRLHFTFDLNVYSHCKIALHISTMSTKLQNILSFRLPWLESYPAKSY